MKVSLPPSPKGGWFASHKFENRCPEALCEWILADPEEKRHKTANRISKHMRHVAEPRSQSSELIYERVALSWEGLVVSDSCY